VLGDGTDEHDLESIFSIFLQSVGKVNTKDEKKPGA
jgi:hypothetical protein